MEKKPWVVDGGGGGGGGRIGGGSGVGEGVLHYREKGGFRMNLSGEAEGFED
jgi:hypothetical protein